VIRVLIADDHEIVRRGLRLTLQTEGDMQLVGEAACGEDVVRMAAQTQPDVVLMDLQMPGMDGISAAAELRRLYPQLIILVLSNYSQDDRLFAALQAGVNGYLLKDIGGDELVQAIRSALRGNPQLHPIIARRLMQQPPPVSPLEQLTRREREVLVLLGRGLSNKEIGLALSLTEVTIKGYVSTILDKLHVLDRTQAALLAVRYGLIAPDDLPDSPRS